MKAFKTTMIAAIIILISVPFTNLYAQEKEEGENYAKFKHRAEQFEKMRSMKIAYLSEQIELTPEEAEKFWPVYNEMEKKRESITHDLLKRFFEVEERPEEISDEDAEKIIQQRFTQEQALLDLKKEYHAKYTEIMPASKVMKLYESENNFRRGLMERLGRNEREPRPEGDRRRAPEREKVEPR